MTGNADKEGSSDLRHKLSRIAAQRLHSGWLSFLYYGSCYFRSGSCNAAKFWTLLHRARGDRCQAAELLGNGVKSLFLTTRRDVMISVRQQIRVAVVLRHRSPGGRRRRGRVQPA